MRSALYLYNTDERKKCKFHLVQGIRTVFKVFETVLKKRRWGTTFAEENKFNINVVYDMNVDLF